MCNSISTSGVLALAVCAAVVVSVQGSFTGGVATWYGQPVAPSCLSSFTYPGFKTIAMNKAQYGQGEVCGACVHACFTPPSWWTMQNGRLPGGQICINAVVTNLCPGCWPHSFDLGYNGNGRWPLTWDYIPCPAANPIFRVIAGNPWYGKIKIEGMGVIKSVTCNGQPWELTYTGCWINGRNRGPVTFDKGVSCVIVPQYGKTVTHLFPGSQFH